MVSKIGIQQLNEYIKKKYVYRNREKYALICLSVLLSISLLIAIALIQYDTYDSHVKKRTSYLEHGATLCEYVNSDTNDFIMTPFAAILLIIFALLYERRSYCLSKCSWKQIGLPMITSLWNKTERVTTGLVYARIAFDIFREFQSLLQHKKSEIGLHLPEGVHDPTGLFELLMKLVGVVFVGIRYYPILVAYRAKTLLLYILATIYMWIDLTNTVYKQGKCDNILTNEYSDDVTDEMAPYWISYKVINVVPAITVSCYIAINLTYRTLATILKTIKHGFKNRCSLCKIKDNYEIIYCHTDVKYVLDLFHNLENYKKKGKDVTVFNRLFNNISQSTSDHDDDIHEAEHKKSFLRKHFYDWNPNFRFTSRFISSYIVAFLALFHFSMFILYKLIYFVLFLQRNLNFINFDHLANYTIADVTCSLGEEYCFKSIKWPLPIPTTYDKSYRPNTNALLIIPFFGALLICHIHLLLGIRDTQKHLLEIFKGNCDFLPKKATLSNEFIAGNSFHYGGYLTGYVIWGFIIQYCAFVLLGIIIIIVKSSFGDDAFLDSFLKLLPLLAVTIFKKINYQITTRLFLQKNTKILALDNFRVFNIVLFFAFFFDCFILGVIEALIRLIKVVIISIIYMPRIAYGFFGRLLEKEDNAYRTYMGYLYIEAAHTNPIMVTFCSLLTYHGLSEHVRNIVLKRIDVNVKFHRSSNFLNQVTNDLQPNHVLGRKRRKTYKKYIVNRWHVFLFLTKNPVLLMYRKVKNDKPKSNTNTNIPLNYRS